MDLVFVYDFDVLFIMDLEQWFWLKKYCIKKLCILGNSLAIQWLGHGLSLLWAWVWSLVGELWSHKSRGSTKKKIFKKLFILRTECFGAPLNFALRENVSLASPSFWPCCSLHSRPPTNIYWMNEAPTCEADSHMSVFKMRKGGLPWWCSG